LNLVPETLHMSFSNLVAHPPGTCACWNAGGLIITLIYNPVTRHWCGGGCGVFFELYCSFNLDNLWHLVLGPPGCSTANPGATAVVLLSRCNPFKQVFQNFQLLGPGVDCSATITIMP
jgi:hypothetical protein